MPTIIGPGDRQVLAGGSVSWLKRGSVSYGSYFNGGSVRLSGESKTVSFESLYCSQPAVAKCVNKLTRQVSRLPLKVYRRDSQGAKVRVRQHPLSDLLNRPYNRKGPVQLKQWMAMPTLLHGNGLIRLFRDEVGGPPTGMKNVCWPYAQPYDDGGQYPSYGGAEILFWRVSYGQKEIDIPAENMLHIAWDGVNDLGVSPLQQLEVTIRSQDALQRYEASQFENGIRPSIAVTLDKDARADKETRDAIRENIAAIHGGVDNAGKGAVFGGGAKVETLNHTAEEAALVEVRKLNNEEVGSLYDLNGPLIGILEHATYSNVDEMNKALYKQVLPPWLVLFEHAIRVQLIDPEPAWNGLFCEFDLTDVLRGDALAEIEALRQAVESGIMSPNEARQARNTNKYPNPAADLLYYPANNLAPLGEAPPAPTQPVDAPKPSMAPAKQQILSLVGRGIEVDMARIKADLERDFSEHLNGSAGEMADLMTKSLQMAVDAAQGNKEQLKRLFEAI